MVNEKQLTRKG